MADSTSPPIEEYKAGRPFVFTDADKLQTKIQEYFDLCDPHLAKQMVDNGRKTNGDMILAEREVLTDQKVYTITGLARHLGVSRRTLINYRNYKHYSDDIPEETKQALILSLEDAVQRVEEFNEAQLHKSGISNGVKFNLTNNFDWQDKQVVETTSPEDDLDALDDPKEERDNLGDAAAKALESETATGSDDKPIDPPSPAETTDAGSRPPTPQ